VTSLAVCSHARRLGIASSLLRQLHYHLHECHDAGSVGLHVRISNEAAVRLYCTEGYGVADIMPLYYGDGE
jgi:peptide alpha-N-acetyltransferase